MFALQFTASMCEIIHVHQPHALAYLDPGTGSIILQALLGVVCGGLFCVKLFWTRMQSVAARLLGRSDQSDQTDK